MSTEIPQEELEGLVLQKLYDHAQESGESLSVEHVRARLETNFGEHRVKLALEALANKSMLAGHYSMYSPSTYEITEAGYKQVEQWRFESIEKSKALVSTDPIEELESKLVPAAGRMVSFGHNEEAQKDFDASIEQAQEIIRSSNTLETEIQEETLNSLTSWQVLVKGVRNFAVGAFNYLVWERLKAALRGSIEDAYKAVIVGIMIALGTLVLGLL